MVSQLMQMQTLTLHVIGPNTVFTGVMAESYTLAAFIFTIGIRSLREGSVFSRACHSVHRGVGFPCGHYPLCH